jgi:pyruvate kinase
MMRSRSVHIVCTIGPASRAPETLRGLVEAGMNVARINFAHGTEEEHRETVAHVRAVSAELGRPVAILQDLGGPKIRLGELEPATLSLETGAQVTLACGKTKGDVRELPVPDEYLAKEARPGGPILLGDGAVELEVLDVDGSDIHCRVTVGGQISSGKGVNAPGGCRRGRSWRRRTCAISSSASSSAWIWSASRTCAPRRTSRRCGAC